MHLGQPRACTALRFADTAGMRAAGLRRYPLRDAPDASVGTPPQTNTQTLVEILLRQPPAGTQRLPVGAEAPARLPPLSTGSVILVDHDTDRVMVAVSAQIGIIAPPETNRVGVAAGIHYVGSLAQVSGALDSGLRSLSPTRTFARQFSDIASATAEPRLATHWDRQPTGPTARQR